LAYKAAIECDPVSAFGGVIACSHIVDVDTALQMKDLFIECVIAPDFDQQALEELSRKKNCRLVVMPDKEIVPKYELRSIMRGFLKQDVDTGDPENAHYEVVTQRMPTPAEWDGLNFAWKACQHVKSNAIVIVQGQATVGIGGGQPNRVDSVPNCCTTGWEPDKRSHHGIRRFLPLCRFNPCCCGSRHNRGDTAWWICERCGINRRRQ
jgi:phosphoribosylaminoimidazolecarboxamide formyltransferase / IMP cyclohydrolase